MSEHQSLNLGQDNPRAFDIHPHDGDTIKLFGWLRGYADFPMMFKGRQYPQADFDTSSKDYTDVELAIYEACGTGEWLAVETYRTRNKAVYPPYRTRVQRFTQEEKGDLVFFFRSRTPFVRKVLNAVGLDFAITIGKEA